MDKSSKTYVEKFPERSMAPPTCLRDFIVTSWRAELLATWKAPPTVVTAGKEMLLSLLFPTNAKLPWLVAKFPTLVKLGATYSVKPLLTKIKDPLTEAKEGVVRPLTSRKVMLFAQMRLGKLTIKFLLLPAMLRPWLMFATWVSNLRRRGLLLISSNATFFKLIPSRLSMKVLVMTTLSAEEMVCGNVKDPSTGRPDQSMLLTLVKTENDSVDNAVTSFIKNFPATEERVVLMTVMTFELFLIVRSPRIRDGPEMSMASGPASEPITRLCKSGQSAYLVKSALELMVMVFVEQSLLV